jgi:hypothetical protein
MNETAYRALRNGYRDAAFQFKRSTESCRRRYLLSFPPAFMPRWCPAALLGSLGNAPEEFRSSLRRHSFEQYVESSEQHKSAILRQTTELIDESA